MSSTTANPDLVGSFVIPSFAAGSDLLTINVTNSARFDGVSGIKGLLAGRAVVEVDAFFYTGDNIVAKEVKAEEEVSSVHRIDFFLRMRRPWQGDLALASCARRGA